MLWTTVWVHGTIRCFVDRNIHEVMFNFVEESKLFCNRRCFNVCQPSLCIRCVTDLRMRRMSLYLLLTATFIDCITNLRLLLT